MPTTHAIPFDQQPKLASDRAQSPNYAPLYQQVKTLLVQRLASNEWPPGVALPSETALARSYGVSQGTVRKALTVMELENLVERRQGRGTFAVGHSRQRALFQFFHLVSATGERHLPNSRVISCQRGQSTPEERQILELAEDELVTRIKRIRYFDERPVLTESLSVPSGLFPGLENQPTTTIPNTLYELYQARYGVMIAHASEQLSAIAATAEDAEWLDKDIGSPLLCIKRRALDIQYRPVEWRVSHCDTESHHYFNELD